MSNREGNEAFERLRQAATTTKYRCLVVQLARSQVSKDEQMAIQMYTNAFGAQSWLHTLIILSYTKDVKPGANFATIMRDRSNRLRSEIAKYAGWDVASEVQSIATQDLKTILAEYYPTHEQATEMSHPASFFFPLPEDALLPGIVRFSNIDHPRNKELLPPLYDANTASLPNYVISLSCLCVTSGPLAALGIIMAGPLGCTIALIVNLLLWVAVFLFCKRGTLSKDKPRKNS